jgi:hypothetical protein
VFGCRWRRIDKCALGFGIDVHDFIAVLSMIFLIFPTFYLWYYMLVDVYEKNKLHFVFMLLAS